MQETANHCEMQAKQANSATMSNSSKLLLSIFIAELLGTFLLVIIGDGSIAAYVVMRKTPDLFTTCLAFGVGAMIGTFVAQRISGAHLNPAATFATAIVNKTPSYSQVPIYMLAQYIGGSLAALALYANYYEGLRSIDGGKHSAFGALNSTGSIFATYPASYVSLWGAIIDQTLGTAVLVFSLTAVCDQKNVGLPQYAQPFAIALSIALICVAFSPNCGAIFNPARDLAPRVVTALLGYSTAFSPLDGFYWLVAGVVGPHVGALLGLVGYKVLVGSAIANVNELAVEEALLSRKASNVSASSSSSASAAAAAAAVTATKTDAAALASNEANETLKSVSVA